MISAIVLAAGLSSRMGEQNKLLLSYQGESIVRRVVDNLSNADPGEVIVVVGHQEELVRESLKGLDIKFVRNENYKNGMTSSIQAGVSVASGDGYMICLSDMYAIESREYQELTTFFNRARAADPLAICIPEFSESRGNPVIFSNLYREKILHHEDPEGCKMIVKDNQSHLRKLSMMSPHVLQDLDYPEDYQRLQNIPD